MLTNSVPDRFCPFRGYLYVTGLVYTFQATTLQTLHRLFVTVFVHHRQLQNRWLFLFLALIQFLVSLAALLPLLFRGHFPYLHDGKVCYIAFNDLFGILYPSSIFYFFPLIVQLLLSCWILRHISHEAQAGRAHINVMRRVRKERRVLIRLAIPVTLILGVGLIYFVFVFGTLVTSSSWKAPPYALHLSLMGISAATGAGMLTNAIINKKYSGEYPRLSRGKPGFDSPPRRCPLMKVIEAYMGPIFPAGFSDGDHPTVGLILLRNTGIGKSFLANILIGIDTFEHRCGTNSVTHETCWDSFLAFGRVYMVFNVSGLIECDQAAIERNKIQIQRAFEKRPDSFVASIFANGVGGRLRDEDLVAFNALTDVYHFRPQSLLFIINDLPSNHSSYYEGEATARLNHLLGMRAVKISFVDLDLTQLTDLHRLTLEYGTQTQFNSSIRSQFLPILEILHIQGVHTTSREDAETISNLFKIVLSNGFPRLRTCIALDIGTFTYNETWIETPNLRTLNLAIATNEDREKLQTKFSYIHQIIHYEHSLSNPDNPHNRSRRFRSEYQKLQALELENKFILDVSPTKQAGFRYEEVFTPSKTLRSIIETIIEIIDGPYTDESSHNFECHQEYCNDYPTFFFSKVRSYRASPCAFYFLIGSIDNILYISLNLTIRILSIGYNIDTMDTSNAWSTIDQFLITSKSVFLRRYSQIKWAHRIAFIVINP
ncbi:hypothetical protein I4U23_004139 [Adineta vaga]|nr:hypothetical protein I4U23_004139 [Adineta vaga]